MQRISIALLIFRYCDCSHCMIAYRHLARIASLVNG